MARIVGRICSFEPLLAQMTQLRKLSLQVTGFAGAEELMPDMAAVSSLEELRLGMVGGADATAAAGVPA